MVIKIIGTELCTKCVQAEILCQMKGIEYRKEMITPDEAGKEGTVQSLRFTQTLSTSGAWNN